jgi:hypothetical protein
MLLLTYDGGNDVVAVYLDASGMVVALILTGELLIVKTLLHTVALPVNI